MTVWHISGLNGKEIEHIEEFVKTTGNNRNEKRYVVKQ